VKIKTARGPSAERPRLPGSCAGISDAARSLAHERSGRPLRSLVRDQAAAWRWGGSLQCFAKTNVGYGAAKRCFHCFPRDDPTRARYLPVPNIPTNTAADHPNGNYTGVHSTDVSLAETRNEYRNYFRPPTEYIERRRLPLRLVYKLKVTSVPPRAISSISQPSGLCGCLTFACSIWTR
jgi:hypothetical protein